jgi:predicted nucleic acid-binding protein
VTTGVDTNALLALLYDDDYADDSEAALRDSYREGPLVITPVVYAELAADGHFDTETALDEFLSDFSIRVEAPSHEATFRAGEAFREYLDRRPDGLSCPSCGEERTVTCASCGEPLTPRQHIAADFIIGAHALADADALISFDSGFYGTYFPSLPVRP